MELKDMSVEELEARKAQIALDIEAPEADLDALEEEARSIKEELEARKAEEAKKAEIRASIAAGEGTVVKKVEEERKATKMNSLEIRSSKEYIDAFVEYVKTDDPSECRALLSENVSGTVAVPTIVEDIVRTAWNEDGIMKRVKKSYAKGNLKVGFEISGSDAAAHTEGGDAVAEETLVLGVVELKSVSLKKWVSYSDEIMDLRGEAFLEYLYREIAHKIAQKAADQLIDAIEACGTVSTTTCPGVPVIAEAASVGTVAAALSELSDTAANPVIIMNRRTWGTMKKAEYANDYAVDPFENLPVLYNNKIKAYSAATTGETYMIVGDLGEGAQANFPNGEDINLKYDDITLMTSDLVRVLGRQFVGVGVVNQNMFCKVTK